MDIDRLYTVNPYNKRHLNSHLYHRFDDGGLAQQMADANMQELANMKHINVPVAPNPMSNGLFGSLSNIKGGSLAGAGIGAAASTIGNLAFKGINGGFSGAGQGINAVGSTIGSVVGKFNPLMGAAITVGSGILGGVTNRLTGSKINQENVNKVKNNIADVRKDANGLLTVNNSDTLINNYGNSTVGMGFGKDFIGKDSVFNHKASRMKKDFDQQMATADAYKTNALMKAVGRVDSTTDNIAMANTAAFGGPLDTMNNMGAAEYGLMSDYINMKNSQAQAKNNTVSYLGNIPSEPMAFADGGGIHIAKSKEGTYKAAADRRGISMSELADRIKANPENYSPALRRKANFYNNFARHKKSDGGNLLIGNNGDTLFALGGDMQTNGGDYSDGLKEINAGKSHEENPYQGVQMGVAPDGSPNLVEEGETIFNDEDYVFSNRIHPKKEVLKKFHMYSKGGKLTYADVSKRLEKEAKERPNDPISKASLKDMLTMLMDAQEQQKAEEEAKEAKKAFEALSPEEQKAVLEQIAQQQQAQANAEQQANSQEEQEIPVDENGNPIEQTEEIPNQEDIAQNDEGSMSAYGGKINKFPDGGKMIKQAILNAIKMKNGQRVLTKQMFDDWAKENNVTGFDYDGDWTKALQNESLKTALTKASPELAYAMANGYGTPYDVDNSPILNTDQTKGNWVEYMPQAWKSSTDAFMKELQWDTIKGMSNKEFADAVRNTNAYKKTTEWLKNADNAKQYFNALLKDDNTPEGAKKWINSNILDSNGNWIGGKYNYDTMLKPVREDNYVGSFWKSAVPATIPDINRHLLVGKDGSISVIDNDDLTGLTKIGNPYKWTDANGNNTYTFYSMPETDANGNSKNKPTLEAVHKPEWLRYTGLAGPATALGMWSMGIGKPSYVGLDDALRLARTNSGGYADYKPIGNYFEYRPMDIWMNFNKKANGYRALDRAIANNNAPIGTNQAALLANGQNELNSSADDVIKAKQYNDNLKLQTGELNQKTDLANAEGYDKAALTNAELRNRDTQFNANLAANIAAQKMNADSQWYNALYGNIGSLFQGIGDLGRENAQHNMIADMAANSLFGTMNPDTPVAKGQHLLRYVDADGNTVDKDGNIIKKKAKGGKLKRRKGLTF